MFIMSLEHKIPIFIMSSCADGKFDRKQINKQLLVNYIDVEYFRDCVILL